MPTLISSEAPRNDYDKAVHACGEMMLVNLRELVKHGVPVEVLVPGTLSVCVHLAQEAGLAEQTAQVFRMYADMLDKRFKVRPAEGTQGRA